MEWEVALTALVHKAGDEAGNGVAVSLALLGTALACLKWLLAGWVCELAQHDKMLWVSKSLWHCLHAEVA